ncbi:MAG: tRNA (adenosine(37)-N6)-dimethylallyltransferase MiaA [bacterium]|nr:tRNA (adenosine(37)-N6)-dimethylallyltransferase MiaA [bacterium]
MGKTALVTTLASRLPLEVISLDSRQIYRGLRIGTAQPTAEELAVCPHHLVDFVDPDEAYDAQRFRRDFSRVHDEITGRGGVPILVGGAGLYLKAVAEGFLAVPGQTPERLAEVRAELERLNDDAIRLRLATVDPASHDRLHANDRRRCQRALEIHLITGRSLTELVAEQAPDPALGASFPIFVLERDVGELEDRIARRTAIMLAEGWIQETETALAAHSAAGPGLMSIGYREIVQFLHGERERTDLEAGIVLATRQYAKRQRTWFRGVEAAGRVHPDRAAETILRVLEDR